MAEWIRVEERLPEEAHYGQSEEVLTWAQNPKGHFQYEKAYYVPREDNWYFPNACTRMMPTHWMPLIPPEGIYDIKKDVEKALNPEIDPKTGLPERNYGKNMPTGLKARLLSFQERWGVNLWQP